MEEHSGRLGHLQSGGRGGHDLSGARVEGLAASRLSSGQRALGSSRIEALPERSEVGR